MHPNTVFHNGDRVLSEMLVDQVGFGMIFAQTADGPRVAHTPLFSTADGALQFHLARGNALVKHLDGATALALINGPDGYVSPRWYADGNQVPTWNYVALEMEGRVRRMTEEGLVGLLESLTARHESRVTKGKPWTMDKLEDDKRRKVLGAIVGFEMEVQAWRPTLKLSQNKSEHDRTATADGLEQNGARAIAQLMRTLGA